MADSVTVVWEITLVVDEPKTYYFISDHLGTGQLLVDDNQQIVWQGEYSPFGQVDVVVDLVSNNFRFPGQYFDAETGLHYNWNRYYDPETGRYVSADPIGLAGGMNLYGYVGGDPVNGIDSTGLSKSVCNISGEWKKLPTLTDVNVDFLGKTYDWGDPKLIPPGVRMGYLNFMATATVNYTIECKKECLCISDNETWTIDKSYGLPTLPIDIPVKLQATKWWITAGQMALAAKKAYKIAKDYYLIEIGKIGSDADNHCKISAIVNNK